MGKRIAIIDLGSNSCRLVIFALDRHGAFRLLDQVSEKVRIGEGGFAGAELRADPMDRAVQLLRMFRGLCDANGIRRVIATATSAVRDAGNRAEFLRRVRAEAGLRLQVLSGEEEGYYAYLGVVNSLPFTDGVIADLGGGSLELVRVRHRLPVAALTLPLGALRLSERFLRHDPPRASETQALVDHIDERLQRVGWRKAGKHEQLVVVGGTARALAKMDQETRAYPLDRLHGYVLTRRAVQRQTERLLDARLRERARIEGLNSERADIVPAGAQVVARLARWLGVDEMLVSGQGLREGIFFAQWLGSAPRAVRTAFPRRDGALALPRRIRRVPLAPNVRALGVVNAAYRHQVDWTHAEQVCALALSLFDQLHPLHGCGPRAREWLAAAALLHDSGTAVDYYRHHRHSAYLIQNADLPGYAHREIAMIALLVRWHRQGNPKAEGYEALLSADDVKHMRRLAALLRLSEDLERSRAQVVAGLRCSLSAQTVLVEARTRGSGEAELWAANRNAGLFRALFGRDLRVRGVAGARMARRGAPRHDTIFERALWLGRQLD